MSPTFLSSSSWWDGFNTLSHFCGCILLSYIIYTFNTGIVQYSRTKNPSPKQAILQGNTVYCTPLYSMEQHDSNKHLPCQKGSSSLELSGLFLFMYFFSPTKNMSTKVHLDRLQFRYYTSMMLSTDSNFFHKHNQYIFHVRYIQCSIPETHTVQRTGLMSWRSQSALYPQMTTLTQLK